MQMEEQIIFKIRARLLFSGDLATFLNTVGQMNEIGKPAGIPFAERSAMLDGVVEQTVRETIAAFATQNLLANELAVAVVDLAGAEGEIPRMGCYRGGEQVYPASVIKLFYMAAAHRWMEDAKLADTAELRRALFDTIVHSYNESTGYILDLLTETTSGPELPEAELKVWQEKRNAVNRYFESLGYQSINANKKTWCEGPYGRDKQVVELFSPSRNWLTAEATARLMTDIVCGKAVTKERSRQMLELLARDFETPGDPKDQAHAYVGKVLPPGAKLWSKAGWTSQVRHDAAYVELPTGGKWLLVLFTENHSKEPEIIPHLAGALLKTLSSTAKEKQE